MWSEQALSASFQAVCSIHHDEPSCTRYCICQSFVHTHALIDVKCVLATLAYRYLQDEGCVKHWWLVNYTRFWLRKIWWAYKLNCVLANNWLVWIFRVSVLHQHLHVDELYVNVIFCECTRWYTAIEVRCTYQECAEIKTTSNQATHNITHITPPHVHITTIQYHDNECRQAPPHPLSTYFTAVACAITPLNV